MGPHGICLHPAPKERGYVDSVAVDVALFTRDDIVRAVVAQQWAMAIAIGAQRSPYSSIYDAQSRFADGQDDQHDHDVEVLAALPCAEDFVAELLGEVRP